MKRSRRLDYSSLADALVQRGLVDPQRISLALQTSTQSQIPFPEFLVMDNLVSDWELSEVACDLFNLPFLPVDFYTPSPDARVGLDEDFLRAHRIVPLDRYGTLLTVCMPAIVTADTISSLAARTDTRVLPVVGTVLSNNKWLEEHMPVDVAPALPEQTSGEASGWSNIFDQGDAAVLMELGDGPSPDGDAEAEAGHDPLADLDQELGAELDILPGSPDEGVDLEVDAEPVDPSSEVPSVADVDDPVSLISGESSAPEKPKAAAKPKAESDDVPLLSDDPADE